ncbi:MAG: prefoldin subunit alpha [archaeon]|nr:prefoldin subunit alpha [archaeon]
MNDDEFQQSIAALDVLRAQIDSAVKQSQFLQISLEEMIRTRDTFAMLAGASEGDEILAPVGMSSFIRVKVADSKLVVVGIGNRVSVDMNTEDATKYMASNIEKTSEVIKKLSSAIEELDGKARTLAVVVQQEYQKRQQ